MKHREGWLDVYRILLAVGWIDGQLDAREKALILGSALRDRLSASDLEQLEEAARWPLTFDDLVPDLEPEEQQFVYGMASLITALDGVHDPVEDVALDALAQVLGLAGARRKALDGLMREITRAGFDPETVEPDALRTQISQRMAGK